MPPPSEPHLRSNRNSVLAATLYSHSRPVYKITTNKSATNTDLTDPTAQRVVATVKRHEIFPDAVRFAHWKGSRSGSVNSSSAIGHQECSEFVLFQLRHYLRGEKHQHQCGGIFKHLKICDWEIRLILWVELYEIIRMSKINERREYEVLTENLCVSSDLHINLKRPDRASRSIISLEIQNAWRSLQPNVHKAQEITFF